jgi:PAS domain-containing protein
LLQVVGAQVATAIENARLFQEVLSGRQTILQSRNTLLALFDGILEGIYIVDQDSTILAINRTQASWAGREVRELIGSSAESAFPNSEYAMALVKETFRTCAPVSHTERQRTDDTRSTEWAIQTYPVSASDPDEIANGDEPSPVDRVVVVVRDVTEQRMLEASLSRSEKLASVGRLAAGIHTMARSN